MNNVRRFGALVAATMAALALTTAVASAPASASAPAVASAPASVPAKAKGPQVVNALLSTARNDHTSWVGVWWKTDRKICDAKLVVWGNPRVDIGYPSNTAHYTSFVHNSDLSPRQNDYTAFRVTPHFHRSVLAPLAAKLTYNYCGPDAKAKTKYTGFLLPVRN